MVARLVGQGEEVLKSYKKNLYDISVFPKALRREGSQVI